MKHIVSDHAVAIGKPFVFEDSNGIEQGEVQMYQCGNTGLIFALDGAWLEDQADDVPLAIPSFVDEGTSIILVDKEEEINLTIKAVGEEHPEKLIDDVIDEMKFEVEQRGDWSAIAELLQFVPKEVLNNYIGIN